MSILSIRIIFITSQSKGQSACLNELVPIQYVKKAYSFKIVDNLQMSMFNKLKSTLTSIRDEEGEQPRRKIDISVLSEEEIKQYKKLLEKFKDNIEALEELSTDNKTAFQEYIKDREKRVQEKQEEGDKGESGDEQYTLAEDFNEIKVTLADVMENVLHLSGIQEAILTKVRALESEGEASSGKNAQEALAKYESQITALKKSEQNNKEILSTLGQQSQLYLKEMKQLQEKNSKLEKEVAEKNSLVKNLKEEKLLLLQMRNNDSSAQIPEVENMKSQLSELEKRLTLQRTRVEQKEKQIEGLKKKMEEDRESLEKIADELKDKELKSKKIIDKYERSKTEIRKYREEKTEFIKQLNMEVAKMAEELATGKNQNQGYQKRIEELEVEVERLQSEVSKNENRKIELQSSQTQLVQVRKELFDRNILLNERKKEYEKLKEAYEQLQQKRKQLLEALQKPVNHEIRTLEKILKALDKLYKQYITVVFQEGNVVGFESKITYIISNVQQIKQDLLL